MATIITRETGATAVNRTLTNTELDNNFINLNADIATRIPSSEKAAANGVATLDATGKVPSTQLPSYVDDVLEAANLAAFPATGETGKIYVALDTNKAYRWSGSTYIYITSGAVDSVAGRTGAVVLTKSDVGLSSVDNTADADKNVLTATKWATARTLSITGDISGSASVDGSANATITATLPASGVTAGSYGSATAIPVITVDSKGRLTLVSTVAVSIPSGSISVTGGDFTMSGSTGSPITNATLATVNSNVGTFNNVTVNAKGLVTAASNVSYLTSYTETDTLATVTARGATTSTASTFSGGLTASGTTAITLSNATSNTITTGTDVNFFINTRDSSAAGTGAVQIRTGDTTFTNSTAGQVSIYAGQSTSATGANVSITAGSVNAATSTGGYVNIRGGTALTGATTAGTGGAVFISGGYAYAASGTKTGGNVYIDGGAPFNAGTNNNGNVYVGTTAGVLNNTGTAAVYVGASGITTTVSGTVKLPNVGTSGFVKLGAGGQLSADTSTYLTGNQSITLSGDASGSGATAITVTLATVNSNVGTFNNVTVNAKGLVTSASNVSYLTAEADTLATVTARGATTSTALTLNGRVNISSQSSFGVERRYYLGALAASNTQARRYEIARVYIDAANWHNAGTIRVELNQQYYTGGDRQVWNISYDYNNISCDLVESIGPRDRLAKVTCGSATLISGNYYYLPIYVDVRYYGTYATYLTTSWQETSTHQADNGVILVYTTPTGSNITDFSVSEAMAFRAGSLSLSGNAVLHAGNYTNYSPTLTGGSASGTWSINVTGSAGEIGGYRSDGWLRKVNDNTQFQMYGNSRTMIYRTDGNTNPHGGGSYAHIFYYGGSLDTQRVFIINTDGRLYSPYHGWLDTISTSGNAATATNISNTGTVTLGTATESNSIYITAPSYTTGSPVKLLNFDWYGNTWAIGNIRSGATPSDGFGVYFQGSEKGRWSSSGFAFQVGTAIAYDNSGGWNANIVSAGQYHARIRARGTSYNSSGDNEAYLWVDNTVSYKSGLYSSTNFNMNVSNLYESGNRVLNASNYSSYALPLSGGTISGIVTANGGIYATKIGIASSNLADSVNGAPWYGIGFSDLTFGATQVPQFAGYYGLRIRTASTIMDFAPSGDAGNINVSGGGLKVGGNVVLHAGNYAGSYLNNTYMRSIGYVSGSNDWSSLGNSYPNTVEQVDPSNFSSTSNGPTAASYTYGTLINFSSQSSSQAQVYISHAGNDLIFRGGWGGASWQAWNKVLTNQNYNSYSPTLTGGGASGTWGISITGNAATVGGLPIHSDRNNEVNKVVRTDANGYIQAGWINTNSGDAGTTSIDRVYASNDGYIRYYTPANFRTVLDVPTRGGSGASGSWGISVTGSSGSSNVVNNTGFGSGSFSWYQASTGLQQYTGSWASFLISNHGDGSTYYNQTLIMPFWGAPQYMRKEGGTNYGPYTFVTSENYTSYSPSLTGSGASGTWGIAITGNAATATRAAGNFYIDSNYGRGVVGLYSSYRYQGVFAMGDSYKLADDGTTTGSLYGLAWSHPNAGGAAGNLTNHGLLVLVNGSFCAAISDSIVTTGAVTAYSDERLKTNWKDLPQDFVARLAKIKVGTFDRIDSGNRQVGVGAQSLRELMPEAILEAKDDMKTLSVSYGNAALASAVELAKEVVDLRAQVERLERLIQKFIKE
jgi:hypothetical protein